jgi:hypothetical protein
MQLSDYPRVQEKSSSPRIFTNKRKFVLIRVISWLILFLELCSETAMNRFPNLAGKGSAGNSGKTKGCLSFAQAAR